MIIGYVRWFDSAKGYGFIQTIPKPGESALEIFAHYKDILGEGHLALGNGCVVAFDVEQNEKGKVAKNITMDVEEKLLVECADALAGLVKKFGLKVKDRRCRSGDNYENQ